MRSHKLLLSLLILIGVFATTSVACRPSTEPRGSVAHVDQRVAVGFAAARAALVALDTAEVFYLEQSIKEKRFHGEDDPAFRASEKRVKALQAVRSTLEELRQHLSGADPSDLEHVLEDLELVLTDARVAGVPIPKDVIPALQTLKEIL